MEPFCDMDVYQNMKKILDKEIILDMGVQHHTLYCTIIARRKQIFRQVYNIYTYALR